MNGSASIFGVATASTRETTRRSWIELSDWSRKRLLDDAHAYGAHAFLCRFYPFRRQYDRMPAGPCNRSQLRSFLFLARRVRSGKPTEANEFVDKTERLDARNRPAWEAGKGLPTWAICGSDSHLQVVLRVEPECRVDARLADRCP
jgi:hypothetical protein